MLGEISLNRRSESSLESVIMTVRRSEVTVKTDAKREDMWKLQIHVQQISQLVFSCWMAA